jgi:lipopolysaccharide transport system permease protein
MLEMANNSPPASSTSNATGNAGRSHGLGSLREYGSGTGWGTLNPVEIWRYRELIAILVVRDLKVRYRQALIGVAWVLAQPIATTLTIALLFPSFSAVTTGDRMPYALFVLPGVILYNLFSSIVSHGTQSLAYNQALITKIYFPRVILLIVNVVTSLCDFVVAAAMLGIALVIYQVPLAPTAFAAPLFVALAVLAGLAIALWTSALNAIYRDTGLAVPFLLQLGLFASPVMYATQNIATDHYRVVVECNAMSLAITGFRACLYGQAGIGVREALLGGAALLAVFLSGLWYFHRVERYLADRI